MEPGIQSQVTSHTIRGLQNVSRIGFYLRIRMFFLVLITVPLFQTRLRSQDYPDQTANLKSCMVKSVVLCL